MAIFHHSYRSMFGKQRNCEIEIITLNDNHDGIPLVIAPGFWTQDNTDWLNFFSKHIEAPIIYVKWKSSTPLKSTFKMLNPSLIRITSAPMFFTSSIFSISTFAYSEWQNAVIEADFAGKDLAKIINDIWNNDDKAIFIGHSLGVRVITQTMQNLKHDNVLTSISIAGAINKDEYDDRISKIKSERKIEHSNIYNPDDSVLKWFYKICGLNFNKTPIGLTCSDSLRMTNYRCNIKHTEYLKRKLFETTIIKLHRDAIEKYKNHMNAG